MHRRFRDGFTLIELLVVIAIIGVLAGLMIPAIGSARAASRKARCQTNIRQVGMGLLGFMTTFNKFPNAGTFLENPNVNLTDPTGSNASVIYIATNDPATWAKTYSQSALYNWVVDILPYLDNKELANSWDRQQSYVSPTSSKGTSASNQKISSSFLEVLVCPDDTSAQQGGGNLSYVVNGGFARWHAVPLSWNGFASDNDPNGGSGPPLLRASSNLQPWQAEQSITKKLGVMFLGTSAGTYPWDISTRPQNIEDGASSTLLLGENLLAGNSPGTALSGGWPTNWACPLPTFCMFLGSDNVCASPGGQTNCYAAPLTATNGTTDGSGWAAANQQGGSESINYGSHLTVEGSFPYLYSGHTNGVTTLFCDGSSHFLSNTIDGTVYAKLITPAGSRLPDNLRQMPLSQDAITQ